MCRRAHDKEVTNMARLNMNGIYRLTREDWKELSDTMTPMRYYDIERAIHRESQGTLSIGGKGRFRNYRDYEYEFTESITVYNTKKGYGFDAQVYHIDLLQAEEGSEYYYIVSAYGKLGQYGDDVIFDNTELYAERKEELWAIHVEAIKTDDERRREIELDECAEALEQICAQVQYGAGVHIDHILGLFADEYDSVYIETNKKCWQLVIRIYSKLDDRCLFEVEYEPTDNDYEIYKGVNTYCFAYHYDTDKYSASNKAI